MRSFLFFMFKMSALVTTLVSLVLFKKDTDKTLIGTVLFMFFGESMSYLYVRKYRAWASSMSAIKKLRTITGDAAESE